jgi:hypothetical protein
MGQARHDKGTDTHKAEADHRSDPSPVKALDCGDFSGEIRAAKRHRTN